MQPTPLTEGSFWPSAKKSAAKQLDFVLTPAPAGFFYLLDGTFPSSQSCSSSALSRQDWQLAVKTARARKCNVGKNYWLSA
jgi:hypothetical protein